MGNFYNLIDKIQAIIPRYNGSPSLTFGYGTFAELNNILDKSFPLVWILTDPNMVTITQANPTQQEQYSFLMMIYQKTNLDDLAPQYRAAYTQTKDIGDGICNELYLDESLDINNIQKTLPLKDKDDVLTGTGYKITLTLIESECNLPFN